MAKKKHGCKSNNRYLGVCYLTVNSFNEENRKKTLKAVADCVMILDKCRIGTYATVNQGQPKCGPQNQGCE